MLRCVVLRRASLGFQSQPAFSNTLCRASWCWGAQCIRTLGAASQRSSSFPSIRRESATEPTPPAGTQNAQFGGPEQRCSNQLGPVRACVTERGASQWPGEQGRCQVSVKQTTGQSIDDGTRSRTKLAEKNQRRIRAYVGPGTWTVERGRVGRGGIWDTIIRNGMGIVWRQNRLTEQTSKGRDSETWNKGPTRVRGACMRVRLRPRLV